MKSEIKACMTHNMERLLDPYLEEMGFKRRQSSLIYKRKLGEATQIVDVALEIHPKDTPNAAAAIYPDMEILIPSVDALLENMIDGNLGLMEGISRGTSRQPIEFTAAKKDLARWYVYQADSVPDIIRAIRLFLDRWTMPFLDVYSTPQDVVATEQRGDARLVHDRAQIMRVVAAALICGKSSFAKKLMEERLGRPGARIRYQQVYDYIQKMPSYNSNTVLN